MITRFTLIVFFSLRCFAANSDVVKLSLEEFSQIAQTQAYTNKPKTIQIKKEKNLFKISFVVGGHLFTGIRKINESSRHHVQMALQNNRELEFNNVRFFDTTFELWRNEHQIELRFVEKNKYLSTIVRLYPENTITKELLDDDFYHDGFPNIEEYFSSNKADYKGRLFKDIIAKKGDYKYLEETHDYIQWLFPKFSRGAALAPLLDDEQIKIFNDHPELKPHLCEALDVMLHFFGFEWDTAKDHAEPKLKMMNSFERRAERWITERNHNFARITRMLVTLVNLGLTDKAQALLTTLQQLEPGLAKVIGEHTYRIWSKAFSSEIKPSVVVKSSKEYTPDDSFASNEASKLQVKRWFAKKNANFKLISRVLEELVNQGLTDKAQALLPAMLEELEPGLAQLMGEDMYRIWSDELGFEIKPSIVVKSSKEYTPDDSFESNGIALAWGLAFVELKDLGVFVQFKSLIGSEVDCLSPQTLTQFRFALLKAFRKRFTGANGEQIFEDVAQQIEIFLKNEKPQHASALFFFMKDNVIKPAKNKKELSQISEYQVWQDLTKDMTFSD